jgi:hypothetical protein
MVVTFLFARLRNKRFKTVFSKTRLPKPFYKGSSSSFLKNSPLSL